MKPLERAKKFLRICRVEPSAIVLHEENRAAGPAFHAKLDSRAFVPRSIFPRVSKQIIQHHAQKARIAVRPQAVSDNPFHVPPFIGADEFVRNRPRHIRKIDVFGFHFEPREPRKVQQIVDQHAHPLRRCPYASNMAFGCAVQLFAVIFFQCKTEPIDAPQRRAQVV